jgi:ABC-type phosphate transport system auxiliary subunit
MVLHILFIKRYKMIEHWDKILYLLGILGAFITGNKSKKIVDKAGEIDNLVKYQLMYDKFISQYEAQFSSLKHKVECLEIDVNNLELRNAIIVEESQNWKQKFSELQKLYDKLKEEFEAYKKKHRSQ